MSSALSLRRLVAFMLLACALTGSLAWSAEMRIAHVDTKLIFSKYAKTSEAQSEYDKKLALWEQEAALLQKKVAGLREKLEKQTLMLSDEKRKELEGDLEREETGLRSFIDRIYGQQGELVQENAKISTPIIQEIRRVINEVALQEGYDMVLDRSSGSILFWKNEHDLTPRVIDILNGK